MEQLQNKRKFVRAETTSEVNFNIAEQQLQMNSDVNRTEVLIDRDIVIHNIKRWNSMNFE